MFCRKYAYALGNLLKRLAGGLGFEPRLAESESGPPAQTSAALRCLWRGQPKPRISTAAFRARRIYVTLAADGKTVNFMFTPEQQEFKCMMEPEAFAPVPNAWGKRVRRPLSCRSRRQRNTDMSRVAGEREAEMHLFSGAIGHAKNPASHRDVEPSPQDAARLIVFASHLLSIIEQRST